MFDFRFCVVDAGLLPPDLAPKIRVREKVTADPFGRAFASRLDGPLLKPTMEITVRRSWAVPCCS